MLDRGRRSAPAKALTVALVALVPLACAPRPEAPAEEQAAFTVSPAADEDPGRLLPIMLRLGQDMGALADALWRDDLATVERAAAAIADHPHVSDAERQRIQGILGDRFPDFVRGDQRVHDSAVRLAERAAAGDVDATLAELAELQSGCVACHQAFRDELRSSAP